MSRMISTLVLLLAAAGPAFASFVPVNVPEPASLTVLAIGAGALLIARARRK